AALMNGRADVRAETQLVIDSRTVVPAPVTAHGIQLGRSSPAEAAAVVADWLDGRVEGFPRRQVLVIVISASPSAASAADGDELGTVIAAWGDPRTLLTGHGEPRALTSDSTRRAGVLATVDPAATVAAWLDLPYEAGAPAERTNEPAPLGLYERYLQQRRLAVPIAAAAWTFVTVAGIVGLLALALRLRLSQTTLAAAGALAASLPWLALALLLVGHLPSLSYAMVIPFLVASVAAGVAFSRWVAARRGILVAISGTGWVILAFLGIEALLGWPAAVTPLAGGGQLDGGRFFGMGNIEIGLVLGCALFAAQRMRVPTGTALIAACALVAGSPWTGSNYGAAITLFATAGLWYGLRRRRLWWVIGLITALLTVVGMAVVSMMHRYLTARPTHVTAFLEHTTGIGGLVERFVDRLAIGADLVRDNPFALIPVLGTILLLAVVLRPSAAVAGSFEGRDAVLVIVLGSIVAYVANDTGAAALGFGFGTALSGLLDVSLATAREKMAA
ncbi:MAG TPA: hypothetical protein VFA25_10860, partial [Actinomycetota bacterium]|nr:hypothetical protein [Actinomycetota bacterium]